MATLRAYLCNCLIGGRSAAEHADGGLRKDTIIWNLNGYDVHLQQKKNIVSGDISKLIGTICYTTDVVAHGVRPKDRQKAMDTVCDLSILLSLVCESRIWPFRWEYFDGRRSYADNPSTGTAQFYRPPLNIRDGDTVHSFVATVWQSYSRVKKKRRIRELVHYLCLMELPENPLQLKLIIAFTILENLKDTWARSRRIPFAGGFFRKVSSPPKANPKKEPKYAFEDMLREMLREMKMRRGLRRIIKLRNDLIHSGLSRRSDRTQFRIYDVCRDIIREYLLRLIGYSGDYHLYSDPNAIKTI